MSHINDFYIDRLSERYNADNDIIPGAPIVTWADAQLLELVKALFLEVELLKAKIDELQQNL